MYSSMIEPYFIFCILYLFHSFSSLIIHVAFMFHRQSPPLFAIHVCYLYSLIKHCDALHSRLVFTRLQLPFILQYIFSCICMCSDAYANPLPFNMVCLRMEIWLQYVHDKSSCYRERDAINIPFHYLYYYSKHTYIIHTHSYFIFTYENKKLYVYRVYPLNVIMQMLLCYWLHIDI